MRRTIGRYRVLAPLGRGGMASVYTVMDPLGELWALKLQHHAGRHREHRLLREYQLQAWVAHPALVPAIDVGRLDDGRSWLVMPIVPGVPARSWVEDGDTGPRLVHVLRATLSALVALHARGVVHADVKPSNMLVEEDGTVRLLDLGLARSTLASWIPTGHYDGTPQYSAPEQLAGAALTPAADLFSWAATAWSLVHRRSPFPSRRERPEGLPPLPPLPPPAHQLLPLLRQCLASAPEDRPDSATLAAALDALDAPLPAEPAPVRPEPGALRPSQEQLLALLRIAGVPLETHALALVTRTPPMEVHLLLRELELDRRLTSDGPRWIAEGPPPAPAPWNQSLARALEAHAEVPTTARAHAALFLGDLARAVAHAEALERVSDRLCTHADTAPALAQRCQAQARDRARPPDDPVLHALFSTDDRSPLGRCVQAQRRGEPVTCACGDPAVDALLAARRLRLQGRHSTADEVLCDALVGTSEPVLTALMWLERAGLQLDIGRVRLAEHCLAMAPVPAVPPAGLEALRVRLEGELAAALGEMLDLEHLRRAVYQHPAGPQSRVLCALLCRARPSHTAIATATAPGEDWPALATAVRLSLPVTGRLPALPRGLTTWLHTPGGSVAHLHLLLAALALPAVNHAALAGAARAAAARVLPLWSGADRRLFELQPSWSAIRRSHAKKSGD